MSSLISTIIAVNRNAANTKAIGNHIGANINAHDKSV